MKVNPVERSVMACEDDGGQHAGETRRLASCTAAAATAEPRPCARGPAPPRLRDGRVLDAGGRGALGPGLAEGRMQRLELPPRQARRRDELREAHVADLARLARPGVEGQLVGGQQRGGLRVCARRAGRAGGASQPGSAPRAAHPPRGGGVHAAAAHSRTQHGLRAQGVVEGEDHANGPANDVPLQRALRDPHQALLYERHDSIDLRAQSASSVHEPAEGAGSGDRTACECRRAHGRAGGAQPADSKAHTPAQRCALGVRLLQPQRQQQGDGEAGELRPGRWGGRAQRCESATSNGSRGDKSSDRLCLYSLSLSLSLSRSPGTPAWCRHSRPSLPAPAHSSASWRPSCMQREAQAAVRRQQAACTGSPQCSAIKRAAHSSRCSGARGARGQLTSRIRLAPRSRTAAAT